MTIEFTCPYCGRKMNVAPQFAGQTGPCGQCGQTITIPGVGSPFGASAAQPAQHVQQDLGENATVRMLLPVGRSIWAIAAGYFGLFAVIPIFAPVALVLGIVAIRDIRRHPKRHGMGRAIFGLVMGLIFSVALIVVFIGIATGKMR
jgi:hypothetical protein